MHIKVKVETDSKKEKFEKIAKDTFKIAVREKAERGEANKKVQEILGKHFERPAGAFKIVSGHHAPHKIIQIQQ